MVGNHLEYVHTNILLPALTVFSFCDILFRKNIVEYQLIFSLVNSGRAILLSAVALVHTKMVKGLLNKSHVTLFRHLRPKHAIARTSHGRISVADTFQS